MAEEGQDSDEQGEQGENKGRTVFGIGLPASVQAAASAQEAARTGGAPPVRGPAPMPARGPAPMPARGPAPQARPAPPVAKVPTIPPTSSPAASELQEPGALDSAHTLHALPSQLLGVVAQATGKPMPSPRVAEQRDDAALRRPQTGDYSATTPDLHASRPTQVQQRPPGSEGAAPGVERAHIRLVAGKAIPGTRYRLLRWLGEGGMGVVYEAEHIDIERRVALKILRAELSERSDTAQVFREEARAAARAGSKNNVEIFDFGELPDGRLFFCMELLSGTDLASLTEGEIESGRVFAILRQICKGLGAAHKAGIVHRDIKPENVLLIQSEGRRDMVKIVDFGVAAILDARRDGGGPIAGTPQYMPPEQISGGDFDARLDIYAVGCVAYEMLVHHPPFTMDNLAEVLLAQLNTVPKRPSEVLQGAGPKSLEDVIMRCLEKDPGKRYENMAELEAALCEAQIAAGVITEWDDLPLPDVEPERRANLIARMPSLHAELKPGRRWLWPAVAAVSAAALLAVLLLRPGADVPPEVVAKIDALSQEARDAASVGNYVISVDDEAVALKKVLQLEALDGPGARLADERGGVLRKEFSSQLVTVADKFYDLPATKSLAYDYYDWVLWFDPNNSHALQRSVRSAGERQEMLERVTTDKLGEGELAGMAIASAAVSGDGEKKRSKWSKKIAMTAMPLSKSIAAQEAMRGAGVVVDETPPPEEEPTPKPVPPPPTPRSSGTTGAEPGTSGDVAVEEPPPVIEPDVTNKKKTPTATKKRPDEEAPDGQIEAEVKRDPAKAAELAGQGSDALRAGRRSEAEALFNQAISFDRKNAEALIGLSDIYFDRGSAQKAQRYAEQAVAIAPNNGSYRIKLGDAYYNALRYRDALTQYEKAKEFGDAKAGPRIAKVKAKLGE
jgi:serine/threonine protein kinase/tetratricopeptide (TPR) repeat protein